MRMVGRDDLVARLRATVGAARAGAGRMVVVSGEAGAGKTAVVRAVVTGVPALWGYCEPLGTPRPLGPFRDIGRQLPAGPGDLDAVGLGERMLDELRADRAVLVVEDAHWIDAASADVLRFLGRRIGSAGGAVLLTVRDEPAADHPLRPVLGDLATAGAVVRVDVPPLTPAEVAEVVAGTAVDPAAAYRLTGGNAFLVGQLAEDGDAAGVAVTVRDSVMARVGRLPAPARALLELLSVVPGRVGADLLGADWDRLDGAVTAGLVRVDGPVVEFRHELVRMAVERQLPPGRRRELNAEVLRRLTDLGGAEPAAIAFHARAAHDPRRALAAERAAAERAAALGSHREAADHWSRAAADAGPATPAAERARLWLALSREQFWTARDADARASARRAVELSPPGSDPLPRSAALRWLSRLTPEQEEAHRLAAEAVEAAEPLGPSAELAAAYAQRATERMLARDLPAAVRWSGPAIELATALGETETLVVALQALGSAEMLLGDPGPGAAHLRRAIEEARAAGLDGELGRAYANLVSAAGESRLYPLADAVVGEALGFFVSRDLDAYAGYTRAWHARCLFELGRWADAAEQAGQVGGGGQPAAVTAVLTARYVQGRLAVRRGGDAGPALAEADRIAAVTGSLQRVAPVAAARAEEAWLAGRPAPAGLAGTYELALARANPWAVGELGLWLWRHGRLDRLPAVAAEPYRLHAGGDPLAAGHAWRALGCPYEEADAWTDSADEAAVRSALATFGRLGARPGRQRAARRLRELGVRAVPRGPRPATARDPDGLTAREQEVLGWVRDGHTDAEIAAGLHLSVRTVGHHVSAVLHKTGRRSRRDLRAQPGQSAGRDG